MEEIPPETQDEPPVDSYDDEEPSGMDSEDLFDRLGSCLASERGYILLHIETRFLTLTLHTVKIPCYTSTMNIIVETEISRLAETLNRLGDDLLPRAVADALNEPARLIAIHAKTNAKKKLIVRTPFTTNSINQVGFARGKNINRMYSLVGSNSPHQTSDDEGDTVEGKESIRAYRFLMDRT